MQLDSPAVNPETAEVLDQIVQLLSGMNDGNYLTKEGNCSIWTSRDVRLIPTHSRTVQLKPKGLYDSFQLVVSAGTTKLFVNGMPSELTLSGLSLLLTALNTAQPNPEIAIVTSNLEDRVNQLLKEEIKPPYTGSPAVNHFYKRP